MFISKKSEVWIHFTIEFDWVQLQDGCRLWALRLTLSYALADPTTTAEEI
jgi:hypothetical protein